MVGLVVVSHSRALAVAAVELAREMVPDRPVRIAPVIAVAAGLDDGAFGTDATRIREAVRAADRGAGVVVLMDLGSAVLSAELALELLDEPARERVVLCPAPLVEGLVVAAVAASAGSSRDEVAAEAAGALDGKVAHLAPVPSTRPPGPPGPARDGLTGVFTVTNPRGLHARPAARLVLEIGGRDVRAWLRNRGTGSEWVPASSLSRVASLGALPGHEIELRVTGNRAAEVVDRVLALAARGFEDAPPPRPHPASRGLGIGPARGVRFGPIEVPDARADDPDREWRRLGEAIGTVRRAIQRVRARTARDLGETEAAIFDAHLLLLDDTDLLDRARARIEAGQAGASAWSASVRGVSERLAGLPDPYLRARATDVDALGEQVLRALLGVREADTPAEGVLVAPDLVPARAAQLDGSKVAAVVLAYGSPTSHAVILLRAKGIPAIVAAGPAVLDIPDGTLIAVDGGRGELVVDPPADVQRAYRERAAELAALRRRARSAARSPAATGDGVEIPVGANIGSVPDARAAAELGADLAGLVRTELLFLGRSRAPGVDEQEALYRDIARAMGGRRITLRTFDGGGDKPLDYLPAAREANPYLGVRGIRLSLANPGLLAEQLLAVVRVAHDSPVSVMFPMVSTLEELLSARRVLDEAITRAGRGHPAELRVGIMVEVPAAALKASVFAPHVDFMSIGTNDLTQYALAADRGNDAVAGVGDPFDPGVLRLIEATCLGAAGRAVVSVCGELAADERAVALLLGLGVRGLSVSPPAVPTTKHTIRSLDGRDAVAVASAALHADSATAVRALLTAR
jgi:phosphoenolpyruvate-protein phosphotransferase/dihydroxyacetone kinase phosphotransfer subunit